MTQTIYANSEQLTQAEPTEQVNIDELRKNFTVRFADPASGVFVIEFPPTKRLMHYRERANGEDIYRVVWWPWTYMVVEFSWNRTSNIWCITVEELKKLKFRKNFEILTVSFSPERLKTFNSNVYAPWLPNFIDPHRPCFGKASNIPMKYDWVKGLNRRIVEFFNNTWNNDTWRMTNAIPRVRNWAEANLGKLIPIYTNFVTAYDSPLRCNDAYPGFLKWWARQSKKNILAFDKKNWGEPEKLIDIIKMTCDINLKNIQTFS